MFVATFNYFFQLSYSTPLPMAFKMGVVINTDVHILNIFSLIYGP